MSLRQRATRARLEDDSKPESVAGGHSKRSKVTKLLYPSPASIFNLFLDTPEFANPRCVHCALCCSSLSLALLDRYFVSVTTSTHITRASWRWCYGPSIHCPRSSRKRERDDCSSEYSGGLSRYLGADNRLLQFYCMRSAGRATDPGTTAVIGSASK